MIGSKRLAALIVTSACLLVAGSARATSPTILFDSYSPGGSGGFSSAGAGVATKVSVENDVHISAIAVRNESYTANRFRFVILSEPAHEFLYLSAPQAFPADPSATQSWKQSDPMDFLLAGGHQYLVGYLRENATSDLADTVAESSNGITSLLASDVLMGFDQPTYSHEFLIGGDESIRLIGTIPEPTFLFATLAAPLLTRRRRRQ